MSGIVRFLIWLVIDNKNVLRFLSTPSFVIANYISYYENLISSLIYRNFGTNDFSGPLPPDIGNLVNLQQLSVSTTITEFLQKHNMILLEMDLLLRWSRMEYCFLYLNMESIVCLFYKMLTHLGCEIFSRIQDCFYKS